jgi:hypothetical protein
MTYFHRRSLLARGAAIAAALLAGAALTAAGSPAVAQADPPEVKSAVVVEPPSGSVLLEPRHSSGCLDLPLGSNADSVKLVTWTCHYPPTANQHWIFKAVPHYIRVYTIHSAATDKCVQVAGNSMEAGALVQQYHCTGGQNERWQMVYVYDFGYQIKNFNSGMCLNVSRANEQNGAEIVQWPCGVQPALNELWNW